MTPFWWGVLVGTVIGIAIACFVLFLVLWRGGWFSREPWF